MLRQELERYVFASGCGSTDHRAGRSGHDDRSHSRNHSNGSCRQCGTGQREVTADDTVTLIRFSAIKPRDEF